ncbi:RWD domain-containing protein 4 [Ischnura elegans]|uniref:RWD domain-containing protein 4 n=1 Tax=Ischnura elegans TaxID=197161 RepID=UPI001ED8AF15|nr:RWD domain-containing protein 4 [Ischnura elegans]
MSNLELQNEEREVLLAIYDGDPAFKDLNENKYQYKYGEEGDPKSFLLELCWGETYPADKPIINMDTFYNKHIVQEVKDHVVNTIGKEAEQLLGEAMTYTLFEWVKEHSEELLSAQPESPVTASSSLVDAVDQITISDNVETKAPKMKKEQLSKAQKRKQWERVDGKGEKPRGWDWVDIVKHLSQTGGKAPETSDP